MLAVSKPIDRVIEKVLATYNGWGRDSTPASMRADWDALFSTPDSETELDMESMGCVPVAWIGATELRRDRVFIYLHGGGYQVGSIRSHFDLVNRLSDASGVVGLAVEYCCAPEQVFPAPIEECYAVYRHLLSIGVEAGNIALVGDSAGGNLALSTVSKLKADGQPLPAAIGLMSPWTDLAARGASYGTRATADPIHQRTMILRMAGSYLGGADPDDPLASPIKADVSGFPPTFIQVGDREAVLDDARDFAAKLEDAGVEVECQVWDEMIHVFQQFPDELSEARQAIRELGNFLSKHLHVIEEELES